MTQKALVKIIQEVVRIEVKKQALKRYLLMSIRKQVFYTQIFLSTKTNTSQKVERQKRFCIWQRVYDALNDVLNETVALK